VAVGTKASDEYFDPVENWDGAVEEGSSEFDDLVGEKNIETSGPNGGFYRQHFNVRGLLRPEIMEQAERTFLREQNRLLRPSHMPSNGFALMGVGVPFDPLMGLALATAVLLAVVFKEKLLNWLEGRAPPKMYAFVNKFVPALQIPWGAAHRFAEKVTRSPWIVPPTLHIVPDPSMGRALRPQEPWRPESTVSATDVVRGVNDKSHLIFSKKGIGYLLSARNSQGQEIGKAAFFGKRGEVTVTDVESQSEEKEIFLALLIDVARAGLFEGGEGRLLIRGTNKTGVVEAALSLFEPDSLLLAPHRFDRDVKNDRWNDQLPRDKFATFVGEMGRFNKFADVSGRLSADVRRNLWATDRVFRKALEQEGNGFREVSLDSTSKMFDVRDTQGNVVGRAICSLSPTTLTLKWIDSNTKGVGWGKSTLLALAMESSRILLPQRNRKGHPVPLVVENIKDARTTHLLMKYILKPGTAEACPANADVPLAGFGASVNWDQALSENDPRFDSLVHSSAGSKSPLFHLRGELRNYIYDLAASRYRERSLAGDGFWPIGEPRFKNNLYFLPLGIPIDPVWGGSLLLLLVGVLLYRDVLLERVGSKLALSRLMKWVKNISKKSSLQSSPLLAQTTPERSSLKALSLSEAEASLFALEIAHDLRLGSLHSETVERGKILYRVEYDAGARFERVGSLFYVSADLWQEHQDYFRNKMGAYLPNLIVLPLETYNMPRHSFLSSHAALLVTKMMGMDLDGKTVIDLGCGQGTLTLTALKLGAKRVVGIDQFPWGNGDLFKAQGVRLGRVEDDPASYDILIVRGRIQKQAPPNLLPHIEGASVLVANVGPTYDVYYEMVPAWSTFPSLEVWLDGGHFSNAVLSGARDFIKHAPGWEVREVFGGLINGDSSQAAPAAFSAQRISNPKAVDPHRPILTPDQGISLGSGETSLEKVFNPNFSVGPGIRVSRRPVNDTLDPRDRQTLAEALGNLLSGAFKMQGVEAMIDPHRLGSGERSGDRLAGLLHLPGGSPWAVPEGMLEGVLRHDSEWILRTRLFASRKLGSQALAKRVVSAAENGDATGAGVALAAWDDSQFLAGPSPDIVAEIMALLTQTNTLSHGGRRQGQEPPAHLPGDSTPVSEFSATRPTSSDGATSAFAKAYNQARSGLLFPKLLGGHLAGPRTAPSMGPGVVLNVSALFDETAPDLLKGQTWLALSSALVPFERDPNFALALVVFGKKNTRAHVENILSRNLPRAVTEALTSTLFVEGGPGSATFFNEGKFSLLALQGRPQWQRDVKVLGFTEETLLKGAKWSVELIPLDATRMPDLQRILKSLQFIKQSA
jgi:SAM-dependent methyltransferase